MPVRQVNFEGATRPRPGRGVLLGVAALALLGAGIGIGSQIVSPRESRFATPGTLTAPSITTVPQPSPVPFLRPTSAGAVAAAAAAITAFDGDVLLDPDRLQGVVARIASAASRAQLIATFEEASAETRSKLGAGTIPAPVIVLRSAPVGYRVEHFSTSQATIAVWYVGIVGSSATVQPQQSWQTELVSLIWQDRTWKVTSFATTDGPTPPITTTEAPATPGQLLAAIPRYHEYSHSEP